VRKVRKVRRVRRAAKKRSEWRGEENGNSDANGLERTTRDLSHDAANVTMIKTHTSKLHMTFSIADDTDLTSAGNLDISTVVLAVNRADAIPTIDDTSILATVALLRYAGISVVSTLGSICTADDTSIRGMQNLDDLNLISLIRIGDPVSDVYDTTICTIAFPKSSTPSRSIRWMAAAHRPLSMKYIDGVSAVNMIYVYL
jgi:hypothetical protein